MILAVDVHYSDIAQVGAVWFEDWTSTKPTYSLRFPMPIPGKYESGSFYKRELPCILAARAHHAATLIIIDGYVRLGPHRPGLGFYVYQETLLPVVGVAKNRFLGAEAVEVRRHSKKPLFVTSVGVSQEEAVEGVLRMAGSYRIPDLLKRVDRIARFGL